MASDDKIILDADGAPIAAQLEGIKAYTVHPPNQGAWICLYLEAHVPQSVAEKSPAADLLPPERFQLAVDPSTAHELGLYLIEKAKQAIEPDV